MPNRPFVARSPQLLATRLLEDIGRELRLARLMAGLTQRAVGERLGHDAAHVSRVEHGLIRGLGVGAVVRHAAVIGLQPWVRLFPSARRPLDEAQLALFARFRQRIGAAWRVSLEAPMPGRGDLRAADALLVVPGCRCMVELITRLADLQAQLRAAHRKQRDLGADRLILVIAATTTNRNVIRAAGPALREALPLDTRATLTAIAAGTDPGADGLVVL